jgi:hypothetical protein
VSNVHDPCGESIDDESENDILVSLNRPTRQQTKGQKTVRLRLSDAGNAILGEYTHFTYVILDQ